MIIPIYLPRLNSAIPSPTTHTIPQARNLPHPNISQQLTSYQGAIPLLRLTPMVAHEQTGALQKLWKKKVYAMSKVQEIASVVPAKQGDRSFTEG